MGNVSKYAYINAKVRGMMGKLLTREAVDSLIGAESFQTMVRLLEQTPYGPRLAILPFEKINSESLDRVFSEDFVDTFKTVYKSAPSDIQGFLDKICMKFEARTLKTLLRTKAANLTIEEAKRYIIPVGTFTMELCEELLREKTLRDMIESIPVKVFKKALEEKWGYFEETENILPLEVAVDQVSFDEIWKYIENEMGGLDKQVSERVIGTEVDTTNIKIILRGKLLDMDSSTIENFLLKASYRLRKEAVQKSLQVKSIIEAAEALAVYPYENILRRALKTYEEEKSSTVFEVELDKLIYQVSKKVGYGYPFQIGTILCYLNLKWFEIKNLKTIVVGKEERIIPIHIRKYLIYME